MLQRRAKAAMSSNDKSLSSIEKRGRDFANKQEIPSPWQGCKHVLAGSRFGHGMRDDQEDRKESARSGEDDDACTEQAKRVVGDYVMALREMSEQLRKQCN
jgi:hypothetical protein